MGFRGTFFVKAHVWSRNPITRIQKLNDASSTVERGRNIIIVTNFDLVE